MPCTCNSICDADCGSNQITTGREAACVNSYSFTSVAIGTVVLASHLAELEAAINAERANTSRRYNASEPANCYTHTPGNVACSNNAFSPYSFSGSRAIGDPVLALHFTNVKAANNEVVTNSGYGTSVSNNFVAGNVIFASYLTDLQTKINQTRNACICDSHCNCDPTDCGCNGECPSDDYYAPYYP
jgi:hypothetical protein